MPRNSVTSLMNQTLSFEIRSFISNLSGIGKETNIIQMRHPKGVYSIILPPTGCLSCFTISNKPHNGKISMNTTQTTAGRGKRPSVVLDEVKVADD